MKTTVVRAGLRYILRALFPREPPSKPWCVVPCSGLCVGTLVWLE